MEHRSFTEEEHREHRERAVEGKVPEGTKVVL